MRMGCEAAGPIDWLSTLQFWVLFWINVGDEI